MSRLRAGAVALLIVAAGLAVGRPAQAQQPVVRREILRTPSGEILDFAPDGGWRNRARAVAEYRRGLLARGNFGVLNSAAAMRTAAPSQVSVTGIEKVPAILFRFSDVGSGASNLPSAYDQVLFGTMPPAGRPYSIRTFYEQMSNGLISIQGQVIGWVTLGGNEVQYTGIPGSGTGTDNCSGNPFGATGGNTNSCNGLFSGNAITKMRNGLVEVLTAVDTGTFDWGQYDNDGPDGMPNSGDDNGVVDQVIFIHSEGDGACGPGVSTPNNHLWSHRSSGLNYATRSTWAGHGIQKIRVRDYTLQSGVGGSGACNTSQIMPVGTAAHETGHAFGLPDLYDTQGSSEGIGEWGLMGSGNYTSPFSPSRMEAWSLSQLGWVTVAPLTTSGTYSLGPAPTSDSAFMIRVKNPNPRGEYYLIENRQAVQSDTALIKIHCGNSGLSYPVNCHGGLAIWHVDSTNVKNFGFGAGNSVNSHNPHGLLLVQPDGLGQLEKGQNRGNAGDLWPGYGTGTPKTEYSLNSTPKAVANDSITATGFQIDQIAPANIAQPDGAMSFRVTFGAPTIVRAADTLAKVRVDGTLWGRFAGLFDNGSMHTVSMDSPELTADGRTRYTFVSWSDGGAQTHTVTGSLTGDSIGLNVSTEYKILVATSGAGTVASTPSADLVNGEFRPKSSTIRLDATPDPGQVFDHWGGDTTSLLNPLNLTMGKPYTITAFFSGPLAVTSAAPPNPLMGKPYSFTFTSSGGTGSNTWSVLSGTLPTGLTLTSSGLLSGTPTVAGTFSATVRVQSGVQTQTTPVSLTVIEPTLAVANVVSHLLGTTSVLTADDVSYLDLIGNNNGSFDLGDFLAWVNKTNATPAPPVVSRMIDEGETEGRVTP